MVLLILYNPPLQTLAAQEVVALKSEIALLQSECTSLRDEVKQLQAVETSKPANKLFHDLRMDQH